MRVEALLPDEAQPSPATRGNAALFGRMLDDLGSVLQRATGAEDAFAAGGGDLGRAVYERAQADVALSVAAAAAQRATQALQTILNMQV